MLIESINAAVWSHVPKVLTPYTGLGLLLNWNSAGGDTLDGESEEFKTLYWIDPTDITVDSGKCRVVTGYVDDDTDRYVIVSASCQQSDYT